jgi:RimJ/RimL family protein N-acetyltransferase
MPGTTYQLQLRPATVDDSALVADLETLRDPDSPSDPTLLRFWWQMDDEQRLAMRRVDERDGAAVAFVGSSHERWDSEANRFGLLRPVLRYDLWSDERYTELAAVAEGWLREEGATTAVARVREDFEREIGALVGAGYSENRRMRISELDLEAHRDEILHTRDVYRGEMRRQGVDLITLKDDPDPEKYQKRYAMIIESERDIPTTVPWRTLTFPEWERFWLGNPGIREEMFYLAREGDAIIGTSVLDCPVVRGHPWTAFTGTVRSVRGRGIARALKYESMGQAIEAGYTRVRTSNDADNPPILRINDRMGYRVVSPVIELHRPLNT